MIPEQAIEGAILLHVAEELYGGSLEEVEQALWRRLLSPPTIHRLSAKIQRDLKTIEQMRHGHEEPSTKV